MTTSFMIECKIVPSKISREHLTLGKEVVTFASYLLSHSIDAFVYCHPPRVPAISPTTIQAADGTS